jgi:uncharacterized alpha-E superfamily protein
MVAELIGETRETLSSRTMDSIFQQGLHEFLTDFVARNNRVTEALSADYHFRLT